MDKLTTHVTRRSFLRGIGLLSTSAALAACAQGQDVGTGAAATPLLAIIHTNDSHGHDIEVKPEGEAEGNFSMAAVAALKADWEQKGYEVLLVDAGDATQGMPLVDNSKGGPAMAFMNACGYDLMTVGNHEFDWGVDALAANEKLAEFPWLSANVFKKDDGSLRFQANKVVELSGGTKVGFFGLTTPTTRTASNPKEVAHFEFLNGDDLYACAQEQVDELRKQGCELVICVGHLGNNSGNDEGTSKDVLQNVQGIDLFVDGHDHKEVEEEVSGTLLVETGCYMRSIGVVAIDEGVPTNEPVAYGTYEGVDGSVEAIIDEAYAKVKEELAVVLGETPFLLNGERSPGVRTQETNLGDFCADALRWAAEQELGKTIDGAIDNGGGIRTSVQKGDITLGTIKAVKPFSNEIVVLDVTGTQLLEALEAACQAVGSDSPIGAFPQVSGITYTVDTAVPYEKGPAYPDSTFARPAAPGSRVTITDVGGRGFSETETYSLAMNDFLSHGGDTYYAFGQAADAKQPTTVCIDYEALASYLMEGCDHVVPDTYAKPQGRITIL